jgi:hypothetical protein
MDRGDTGFITEDGYSYGDDGRCFIESESRAVFLYVVYGDEYGEKCEN